MFKCAVNSWILFLFVAQLGFPLIYGCPKEWFGSLCQYKCHCTGGGCDAKDGDCAKGDTCQRGWFGPACQYVDLAITADSNVALATLTDGDEKTCLNSSTKRLTVTWTIPYQFTWIRVHGSNPIFLEYLFGLFSNGTESAKVESTDPKIAKISDTAMDVYFDMGVTAKQMILQGPAVGYLCSLQISGGRNVALKQNTIQSSSHPNIANSKSSNAVDGSTNADYYSGSCIHTAEGDPKPQWNVTFSNEVAVNRYVIYNRMIPPGTTEKQKEQRILDRLQGFNLTSYNRNGQNTFEFIDRSDKGQKMYVITAASGKNKIAVTSIRATHVEPRPAPVNAWTIINICEVEVYGDSVWGAGHFGRECEKLCKCAVATENCFVSTGGCPSGCAPGFSGERCQ